MIEQFLQASNLTPEEQALLNEILDANSDPIGINVFDLMSESLQQALAYERGEIELPTKTYEHTFPDCPPCWQRSSDDDCSFKEQCNVLICPDTEQRIGLPSKYVSLEEGRAIDALNEIGCTSFWVANDEIRNNVLEQRTNGENSLQEVGNA